MTPLVIPGKEVEAGNLERPTALFRINGESVIPGSSLRGPIRSVYEALTDSCMRMNDTILTSAGGTKLPGLLRYDAQSCKYVLFTARRYRVRGSDQRVNPKTKADRVTGESVYITFVRGRGASPLASGKVTSISDEAVLGATLGYYLRVNTLPGDKPNNPSVFVENERVATTIDERYVKSLEENVRRYVDNYSDSGQNAAEQYQACLSRLKSGATLPVWYSYELLGNGSYAFHFAWAQYSRNVYPKTTHDFAREEGLLPCSSETGDICPACELFGYVQQESGSSAGARAGRVRFGDARPDAHVHTMDVILPILALPKIQANEFYLRNEKNKYGFTPLSDGTVLAGRKMYWHSRSGVRPINQPVVANSESDSLAPSRFEAIAPSSTFHFNVYFDGVSKQQLNELVYVLSLGQAWNPSDKTHWHKIGHGKPVGAGSALIQVEDVLIRSFKEGKYAIESWDAYKLPLASEEGKAGTVEYRLRHTREVLRVTDSTAIDEDMDIDYPRTVEGGDIFEWFGKNRERLSSDKDQRRGKGQSSGFITTTRYNVVLPGVLDESQAIARKPWNSTKAMPVPHPPTTKVTAHITEERGTVVPARLEGRVDSLKSNPDGRWYGWIRPASGGSNIYFQASENKHLGSGETVRRGTRVTYEIEKVERKGKVQSHAVKVEPL